MRLRSIAQVTGCLAAVALLSACASGPTVSSEQETSTYLARAGRHYTPPGPSSDPWGPYITEAAAKYDVPERWIREVMRQESGGNLYSRNGNLITSGAGAMGLMQVMPATYDDLRRRYRELGDDPFDPHNNILAGTAYIREMYDIYGSPAFLAAYNAGPGRLDDYLTRSRTLPEETRRYVAAIGPRIAGSSPNTPSPGEQYAANATPFTLPDSSRYASRTDSRYSESTRYAAAAPIVLNPAPYTPPPAPARAPIQLAQLPEPPQPYIRLNPPVQTAQIPEPPQPFIRLSPQPTQVAQLPEPPRPASPPPREYAALAPVQPRNSPFALFTPANASPIMRHQGGYSTGGFAPGGWAVQVGAFANPNLAASATAAARDHARDVLGSARTTVASVRQPGGVLYRARLTGLSRDAAAQACERLARARTNCMVVSPDAQS